MSEADALLMDQRARREALDVRRSLLLQAPAGSGKTTVLTARYLALLAAADAPEQILAITFTRKAAAEMRHRILAALQAAEEHTAIAGIDPRLLEQASARDRARGWQLRRHAARLRIETIDALSYRLASALPIAARSGPALKITATPGPLYRQAARAALRAALEQPATAAAVRLLLDRLDNRWLRLERLLAGMLARRSHWLPRVLQAQSGGLVQRVTESLDAVLRAQLAGLAAAFSAEALREAEQLLALRGSGERPTLSAEPTSLVHWRALCELTLTVEGQWRQRFTAREGLGQEDGSLKRRLRDWIEAQCEPQARLALCLARTLPEPVLGGDEQDALSSLALLLTGAAAELQLQFAEQGKVDYAYVAAAARAALSEQGEPSDLALHASAELRHILLDEFQDTSLEQFELLRALTAGWERGDGRTLFIVGDPMQSIYQFREAEVGLFLRVRDCGLGAISFETLQLRRNFRSRVSLIDWINTHFALLFPQQDDPRLAAVRFLSSAAPVTAEAPAAAAVSLHRVAPGARAAEAARVLEIVTAERHRSAHCSIAVLVAAREHAALIVARLRAAGYVLRGVDLEPLRDRPAVRDLSALARALLHGGDRTGWLSVLRAPWCGLTLAALEHFVQQADSDLFGSLRAWAPAQSADGARVARLCAALEPAVRGSERGLPLWQRVERCWLRLGGPAIYPEAADRLDAHRFMDALATHEQPDALVGDAMSALTEPLFSVAPAQPGAIEVMTIHAAKGLEWDVVIVPGLDSRGAPDTDPLLHWIDLPRPGDGSDLLLAPIRAADEAPEGLLAAYIKRLRRSRQGLERIRQLYVAATRARDSLHLLGAIDCLPLNGKPPTPTPGSLLASLWPAIAAQFCAPEVAGAPPAISGTVATGVPLRRLPFDWLLPPPPALPRPQRLRLSAEAGLETPEYSWVGLTARTVGTIVHAELRRLASQPELPQAGERQQRAGHYGTWLSELGVAAEAHAGAEALIIEALERTLADPRGRWLLSAQHPAAESEWRLTGVHEGRIVNVVFDRMLIDDQRQRWIIDYKTSRHEGGELAQFIEREAERYTPQLQRYAALAAALGNEVVRVALYFPLLGVFRELSP